MVFLTDFTRPQRDVLVTLSLVGMTSALYQTVILPFVAFFIVDTGVCDNLFDPGYYASFVTGAGHVGRMFTSFAWGRYSDRHGRVPVIKLALVAIAASSTLLSWTLSFRLAILCRFVCGALDPTWSMVKVLAAELLPKERQAAAMSSLGASYGMAMLLGPAIGGILARPATEYPMLRIPPDAMLAHRPYFLPNIMIVAIALATLMVTGSVLHDAPSQKSDSLLLSSSSHPPNKGYGALPEQRHESDCCSAFCCTRKPALATAFYALISCVEFTEDLVFPLWAAAPRSVHGLALTSSQIGLLLAIAGAAVVPGQLLFYPSVDRRLTTLGVMRLGCVVTATLTALMPLAAVGNNSTWMWSCLCATKVLRLSVAGALRVCCSTHVAFAQSLFSPPKESYQIMLSALKTAAPSSACSK